jgi:hypothetical protein
LKNQFRGNPSTEDHSAAIQQQWKKTHVSSRETGRPHLIPGEIEEWIAAFVSEGYGDSKPITSAELLSMVQYQHSMKILSNRLRELVRNMPAIKSVLGILSETERHVSTTQTLRTGTRISPEESQGYRGNSSSMSTKPEATILPTTSRSGCSSR